MRICVEQADRISAILSGRNIKLRDNDSENCFLLPSKKISFLL